MTAITRYEFDAHLNAVETRFGSKIDAFIEDQRGRDQAMRLELRHIEARVDLNIANMKETVAHMKEDAADIRKDVAEIKRDYKTMRYWLLGTTVTTVLGVASINATMVSNMKTFFESGFETAIRINELHARSAPSIALTEAPKKANPNSANNVPTTRNVETYQE